MELLCSFPSLTGSYIKFVNQKQKDSEGTKNDETKIVTRIIYWIAVDK